MSHFTVFVSACLNSFISARTHCRSVTPQLNNRPGLLVPLSSVLPNEPHRRCIHWYCIICKIHVCCTVLKFSQSGGTEFPSRQQQCPAWCGRTITVITDRLCDDRLASSFPGADFTAVPNVLTLAGMN